MSAALIPLTVAPFAAGSLNPVIDAALCFGVLIHSHIGFQYVWKGTLQLELPLIAGVDQL